jgi:hypothetical protein
MQKSLEQYFRSDLQRLVLDHRIRAQLDAKGDVVFYIHPDGRDGDTLDFKVVGNTLTQLNV